MGLLYRKVIAPLLYRQDPAWVEEQALACFRGVCRISPVFNWMRRYNLPAATRPIELFGLRFPNAVGLAAGVDRNGQYWQYAPALGFGHVEIGTVTYNPQPSSEAQRLFYYPNESMLIHKSLGDNSGARVVAETLRKGPQKEKRLIPLGINIGKSKFVTYEESIQEHLSCFACLADYADYFTVDLMASNQDNLKRILGSDYLRTLLSELQSANQDRARKLGRPSTPLLVKISPDLSFNEIDNVLEALFEFDYKGIVATSASYKRPGATGSKRYETGSMGGRPLGALSLPVIRYISKMTMGKFPIIGCGGMVDEKSAGDAMDAGASLVQVYSGLLSGGPFIAARLANALSWRQREWI